MVMVTVKIRKKFIKMNGHACCNGSDGVDRVCSAISALTCNLINSLCDISEDKVYSATNPGETIIEWEHLSEKGRTLVDAWFLGIAAINDEYNCIQFQ